MSSKLNMTCDGCGASAPNEETVGRWYSLAATRWFLSVEGNLSSSYDACSSACAAKVIGKLKEDVEDDARDVARRVAEANAEALRLARGRMIGRAIGDALGVEDEEKVS